jgi:AbrB family looped-hinge helix DNA binding protein
MKNQINLNILKMRTGGGEVMTKHKTGNAVQCCGTKTVAENAACCKVEALVPVDGRGQIVLPKDVRDKAGIEAGDKLAVISFESDGKVCCITLVKADAFAETVKGTLGPMMSEILQGSA